MKKQIIDINLLLPQFYPKQRQISLKLNPLLKTVRQNNILSLHQFQDKKNALKSSKISSFDQDKLKTTIFNKKDTKKQLLNTLNHDKFHKRNFSQNLNKTNFSYNQNYSFQPFSKQIKSSTIDKLSANDKLGKYKQFRSSQEKRNHSFKYGSQAQINQNKKNYSTLTPKTADFDRTKLKADFQKISRLIQSPQVQLEDLDEDLCNYIRLKLLTKKPYFPGGKFSKIKKHLVQDINFEEIQKKFYKTQSTTTKYKQFYQQILLKNKQNSAQNTKRQNRFTKNTLNIFFQKQGEQSTKVYSKNYKNDQQRQNFYSPDILFTTPDKIKKISVKARFWSKATPLRLNNFQKTDRKQKYCETTIQIKGEKKMFVSQKDYKRNISPGLQQKDFESIKAI